MFMLLQEGEKWRAVFRCDKCNEAIDDWDTGMALIHDEEGKYEPRSHFHDRCLPESKPEQQMPLRDLVGTMVESIPL